MKCYLTGEHLCICRGLLFSEADYTHLRGTQSISGVGYTDTLLDGEINALYLFLCIRFEFDKSTFWEIINLFQSLD